MNLYATISKVEDNEDGTVRVYGIASSGVKDEAGEIITPGAMKAALPGYFAVGGTGALREMHQPSAAGKVDEATVDDSGHTNIGAHVVDPLAIKKLKAGVYKGFSVGGKVTARDPEDRSIITGIKLVEISLVDRPCNPDAVISMWKADEMSNEAPAYAPTNDEVKALADEMATAAGKPGRRNDYVVKAREDLISKHAAAVAAGDEGDGDGEVEPATEDVAVKTDVADPAAALADALAKARALIAEHDAPKPTFAYSVQDLKDAAAALTKTAALAIEADADVAKGLYMVSALARAIDQLSWIQQGSASEEQMEGDPSPVPAALASGISALGSTLVMMAQEEVAELIASMKSNGTEFDVIVPDDDDGSFAMASKLVDLVKADTSLMEKAGARHSKGDMAKIQATHDNMMSLGAKCDSGNCDKAAEPGDLAKLTAENERLAKALADAVPATDELGKAITAQNSVIATLRSELDAIKLIAAPPKTAASTAVPVTKDQDANPGATSNDAAIVKVIEAMTPEQLGFYQMKAAQRQGVVIAR